MAIETMRRLTFTEQALRNVQHRVGGLEKGRLALEVRGLRGVECRAAEVLKHLPAILAMKGVEVRFYTPLGIELNAASLVSKTAEQIDAMAAEVDALSQAANARQPQIEIPEMVALSGKVDIMKGEVTVGLFKQVMAGYEITGHNAESLIALRDDPTKAGEAVVYVNLHDAREFAKRLSEQTGRKFRVQTEAEWKEGRAQLSGDNWTWTTDETEKNSGRFVLRHLRDDDRDSVYPEDRCNFDAVRVVEDK